MHSRSWMGVACGVGVAVLAACSLAVSLDGLTGGMSPDSGLPADAPPDVVRTFDASDAPSTGDDGGPPASCAGDGGPAMVNVGPFCIDATEVTNQEYAAFLATLDGGVPRQPSYCAWNTSVTPAAGWPFVPGTETLPVVYVNWCDAFEYCAWAGKHLCGAVDGGPADPNNPALPSADSWYFACSANGQLTYPYGNTYEPQRCNGADFDDAGGLVAVGSTGCTGGFPGIDDMSGNAEEWEDSCTAYTTDSGDNCQNRGGAFDNTGGALACGVSDSFNTRDFLSDHTGFRCCSP